MTVMTRSMKKVNDEMNRLKRQIAVVEKVLFRLRATIKPKKIIEEEALQRIMNRKNDIPKYKQGTIERLECTNEVVTMISNELNDDVKLDIKNVFTDDRNITIFMLLRKSMIESRNKIEHMSYSTDDCCCEKYATKRQQMIEELKYNINTLVCRMNAIVLNSKPTNYDEDWIKKLHILIPDIMESIEEDEYMY